MGLSNIIYCILSVQGSLDPLYIVSYYINWIKTSLTNNRFDASQYDLIFSNYRVANSLFGYDAILASKGCSVTVKHKTIEMQILIFEN